MQTECRCKACFDSAEAQPIFALFFDAKIQINDCFLVGIRFIGRAIDAGRTNSFFRTKYVYGATYGRARGQGACRCRKNKNRKSFLSFPCEDEKKYIFYKHKRRNDSIPGCRFKYVFLPFDGLGRMNRPVDAFAFFCMDGNGIRIMKDNF